MPTYPIEKTYRGGFYNNHNVDGVDDRVYSAEDVRKPYDTVFSDGVLPTGDGTAGDNLAVSLSSGMSISIAPGHAKLGGAWFENTSAYTITLDNAGSTDRYDCVILRNDDSEDVREPSIYIKSLSRIPTISDLTRGDYIYEVCIAYVRVPALATALTAANIIDTRTDGSLCNVMSGVGAMVVRTYRKTYFSEMQNQTAIPIGIPQYNKSKDDLSVMIEGRVFTEGTNFTITDNSYINLAIGLPVIGTKIQFEVRKNVNAAGAESVIQEVAELREEMTAINGIFEHHYYCNGQTDNAEISKITQQWLNGGTAYDSMRLVIHGAFGATSPYSGEGTSAAPYIWIMAGGGGERNRKVILDFSDCRQISINCDTDSYNIIFYGLHANIYGANAVATGGAGIYMFSLPANTIINAEKCRFWITAELDAAIARSGTFKDCRGSVTVTAGDAFCFEPTNASLLRLIGGEYYAYTGVSGAESAVIKIPAGQTEAVAITYGVSCPTVARSSYFQTHSIKVESNSATCSFTDTITTLPIIGTGQNIRGTLAVSKAGMM